MASMVMRYFLDRTPGYCGFQYDIRGDTVYDNDSHDFGIGGQLDKRDLLPFDVENRTIYQGPPLSKVSHFVPNG